MATYNSPAAGEWQPRCQFHSAKCQVTPAFACCTPVHTLHRATGKFGDWEENSSANPNTRERSVPKQCINQTQIDRQTGRYKGRMKERHNKLFLKVLKSTFWFPASFCLTLRVRTGLSAAYLHKDRPDKGPTIILYLCSHLLNHTEYLWAYAGNNHRLFPVSNIHSGT